MAKYMVENFEVKVGSESGVADIDLPDSGKLKIKIQLANEIIYAVRKLGLTQEKAARRIGIPQPKVWALSHGNVANISERKLMDCLNQLGYDIEIKVKPSDNKIGYLNLAIK
jgi:predicted XRE-type DNA-binding protein